MPRRAARLDSNQAAIVAALRAAGCRVQSLAGVGEGVPDLLVGRVVEEGKRRLFLLEVKDGSKKPSAQRLTPKEAAWHAQWQGYAVVVRSVNEALAAVGLPQNRTETGG